jgi:hypothetical protein
MYPLSIGCNAGFTKGIANFPGAVDGPHLTGQAVRLKFSGCKSRPSSATQPTASETPATAAPEMRLTEVHGIGAEHAHQPADNSGSCQNAYLSRHDIQQESEMRSLNALHYTRQTD